jgi:hypothetical protein
LLFDRRYGVDTDRPVALADLGIRETRSIDCMPAGISSLRRIFPRREVTEDDVFIDFGSGKGRVVLQAAMRYPFRRVHGVELSQQLHGIAERNVDRNRHRLRCRDVELTCANALDYPIPDNVTVAFFYNPFTWDVFRTVVSRLLESLDRNPRRLRIIYGNPREEAWLLSTGRVEPVRTLHGWRPGREWSRSNSYRLYEVHRQQAQAIG